MGKGYLKNTITYAIIVLSRKIFKQISEVLCNRAHDSGNQTLLKSASNMLAIGKSCFGYFCSNEKEIF